MPVSNVRRGGEQLLTFGRNKISLGTYVFERGFFKRSICQEDAVADEVSRRALSRLRGRVGGRLRVEGRSKS